MITSTVPDDWQTLQREVGRILSECGFAVEVEKKVQTVRGVVELDVYAEEELNGRKYSIVCECKNWRARVPQSVVHSFRTVIADIGANAGYIVSVSGFQEGAFNASGQTNVEIVTWEQFQSKFEKSWLEGFFTPSIVKFMCRTDIPTSGGDQTYDLWFSNLAQIDRDCFIRLKEKEEDLGDIFSDEDKERFIHMEEQCHAFGWIIGCLIQYSSMKRDGVLPTLPLIGTLQENPCAPCVIRHVPANVLRATGFRECLEETSSFGDDVIDQFQDFLPREA